MSDRTGSPAASGRDEEPGRGAQAKAGPGASPEQGDLLEERADPRTNTIVKFVLRTGLALALALLVVGLIVQLASGHDQAIQVRMFDLFAPRPVGEKIMGVGVLFLTLTPACGVLSVVLSWVRERDRIYIGVGAIVVAVLCAAVIVGFSGG